MHGPVEFLDAVQHDIGVALSGQHHALHGAILGAVGLHGRNGLILLGLVFQFLEVFLSEVEHSTLEPLGNCHPLLRQHRGLLSGGLLNPDVGRFQMAAVKVDLQTVTQVTDVVIEVALCGAPIDGVASTGAALHILLIVGGENLVDLVPSVLLAGDFDVCHDVVLLDGFLWMRNKKN